VNTPFWQRYRHFIRPDPRRDLADEFRFHLESETEELIAAGVAPEDARRRALEKFGDVDRFAAECHTSDARRLGRRRRARLLDAAGQDVRYALRGLVRRPAFTAATILVLALGIGANAAVFSVADLLFLRPPALAEAPQELKRIFLTRRRADGAEYYQVRFSLPDARLIAAASGSASSTIFVRRDLPFELAPGSKRALSSTWVTPTYFDVVGVRLHAGSVFGEESMQFGAPPTAAIISWNVWQSAFGGDPRAVGRVIHHDGKPVVIRGIAPRGFTGIDLDVTDIWLPLAGYTGYPGERERPWHLDWSIIAFRVLTRVASATSMDQLSARIEHAVAIGAEQARADNPRAKPRDRVIAVIPAPLLAALGPEPLSHRETIAALLSGLAMLLLVIAIANVGNLLLGRALDRQREISVRVALGMSRGRLLGQLTIEATLLALAATAAAVIATMWMGAALRAMLLPGEDLASGPLDVRVIVLAFALGVGSALVAALVPLASTLRLDLTRAIKTGARDGGGSRARVRFTLVAVQAALSVVLLTGTGLVARSLHNVRSIDLGLDVDRLVTVRARDANEAMRLPEVAAFARQLPGVAAAALAAEAPFWDHLEATHLFDARGDTIGRFTSPVSYVAAEPGYLRTVGTSIIRGRDLRSDDHAGASPVMIVSAEMARHLSPGRDPIGECVRIDRLDAPCHTIVGIARNAHQYNVVEEPRAIFYVPIDQMASDPGGAAGRARALVIRAERGTASVAARLRAELHDTASTVRDRRVRILADAIEPQFVPWQTGARLFASFAALALVLAWLGFYGVASYVVALRTRELGVRLALGASRRGILALVLNDGTRQIAVGVLVGVGVTLATGSRLAGLLFGVAPTDPVVIASAVVLVALGTALAAAIPARRAMAIDPMQAIREE
jgi:putative ABC transport system permease protein